MPQKGRHWYEIDSLGRELRMLDFQEEDSIIYRRGNYYERNSITNDPWASDRIFGPGISIIRDEGDRYGLIDSSGKAIVFPKYEFIRRSKEGFVISEGNKMGFISERGEILIEPIYKSVRPYYGTEQLLSIHSEKGVGLYDVGRKKFILLPEYKNVSPLKGGKYFKVERENERFWIDRDNQRLGEAFQNLEIYFEEGYFGVMKAFKKGLIDSLGQEILATQFYDIRVLPEGFLLQKNGKWGFKNKAGKQLIPFDYEELIIEEQAFIIAKKNGKKGLFDLEGNLLLDFVYEDLILPWYDSVRNEVPIVFKQGGKEGIINPKGEILIPAEYEKFYLVNRNGESYFRAIKEQKFGLINSENESLVPFLFEDISFSSNPNLLRVKYGGYYGLIKNPIPAVSRNKE